MIALPIPDQNDSLTEITLDDVVYFLHLAWNSQAESWTFGFEDAGNVLLLDGIPIVPNAPLMTRFALADLPQGELIALAQDQKDSIGYDDLVGGKVKLFYVSQDELEDILTENAV